MRKYAPCITLLLSTLFCSAQQEIKIGGYTYLKKASVTAFLKQDGLDSTYSLYVTKDGNQAFGCEMLSTRNDSIFRKSTMDVDEANKTILCKERFFFKQSRDVDSIYTYYKQLNNGNFKTDKIIEYKNGVAKNLIKN